MTDSILEIQGLTKDYGDFVLEMCIRDSIRGMGASANTVIYASQQEADDECERLARLFLQCTPRERKLIAAIIDTILDQHRQEDTPDEKA